MTHLPLLRTPLLRCWWWTLGRAAKGATGGDLHDDATTRREKRENSEGREGRKEKTGFLGSRSWGANVRQAWGGLGWHGCLLDWSCGTIPSCPGFTAVSEGLLEKQLFSLRRCVVVLIPLCALPALRCYLGESRSTRWSEASLPVRFQVTVKGPRLPPNTAI